MTMVVDFCRPLKVIMMINPTFVRAIRLPNYARDCHRQDPDYCASTWGLGIRVDIKWLSAVRRARWHERGSEEGRIGRLDR